MQKSQIRDFVTISPLYEIGIDPDFCLVVVGIAQLVYAICLCCEGDICQGVSLVSFLHMLGTLYIHYTAGHPYYRMIETIVCLVLCVMRYIL